MQLIHYLNQTQAKILNDKPQSLWEWYKGQSLHSYQSKPNHLIDVETLVCYSEDYLTVSVKSNQRDLSYRDRAYQNGDGFHFILAKPTSDGQASREFYVIGVSPLEDNWQHKFIWYRNVDLEMIPLNDSIITQVKNESGHIMTLHIPWHEIDPIQGLFASTLGFNMCYVQAEDDQKNFYILKNDPLTQNEQSPREYCEYEYEVPSSLTDSQCHIRLSQKHCEQLSAVSLEIALNSIDEAVYTVDIIDNDHVILSAEHKSSRGLEQFSISLDEISFSVGLHQLEIEITNDQFKRRVTRELFVYDNRNFDVLSDEITQLNINSSDGFVDESIHTLKFYNKNLNQMKEELKGYESFSPINSYFNTVSKHLETIKIGQDLFDLEKVIRLGHLSALDDSLQPYSLYVPSNLDADKKLLVYLHGSGSDDRSLNYADSMMKLADESNCIIVAPYARGTSHMYSVAEAIEDVVELTKKMSKLFEVKEKNIILGGFSMGGYGTYRIFDHAPQLYNRLLVLSGHPSLGLPYGGFDYSKEENIKIFKDIPMIVFHGKKDLNCSYQEQEVFFDSLSNMNENCQIHIHEEAGHCGLIEKWYPILLEWIN